MARVPAGFDADFERKGETFRGIAECLYTNPDRRYTQAELAEQFDVSRQAISAHLREMEAEGWIERQENQTTFVWDTEARNPGSTEWHVALKRLYADCWAVVQKHTKTGPGVLGLFGLLFGITASGALLVVVAISLSAGDTVAAAQAGVLGLAAAFLVTSAVMTALAPVQAILNKLAWRALLAVGLAKK